MAQHLILNRINIDQRNIISTYFTSINWPMRFMKQHPQLKGLIAEPIEQSRNATYTSEIFNK